MMSFDHNTFIRIKRNSDAQAAQYRIDCGLEKPVSQENEEDEKIEFSKEELQEKLRAAWIRFAPLSGEEVLLKKCVENNLI